MEHRTTTEAQLALQKEYKHLGVKSIDVPPGWLHIARDLLAEIDRQCPDEERGAVVVSDVKEKHNRLSVMCHAGEWSDLVVDLFESLADATCPVCGKPKKEASRRCGECGAGTVKG